VDVAAAEQDFAGPHADDLASGELRAEDLDNLVVEALVEQRDDDAAGADVEVRVRPGQAVPGAAGQGVFDVIDAVRLVISTCSPARSVGNSLTSVRSACRESPMPWSWSRMVTTPAAEPTANATNTKASQPRTAARRCEALHRAARAVTLWCS
jgi:hypothetical protein